MRKQDTRLVNNALVADSVGELRGGGLWRRMRCPLPACDGVKARNLAVHAEGGWVCHLCEATGYLGRHVRLGARGGGREGKSDEQRIAEANDLFETAVPILPGSIGDGYLRGIRRLRPPHGDRWPGDLRFLPRFFHFWSRLSFPALIAGARDIAGMLRAVIITFLAEDGTEKADVRPGRISPGVIGGCAVRLGPDSSALIIAEGVETSIAAANQLPGYTPWAAGSAGGMRKLVLPQGLTDLVIVADHDPNQVGLRAARALRTRVRDAGCRARILMPREPDTDANDLVIARAREVGDER